MSEERELRDRRWVTALRRREDGAPLLPPRFVVEQGPTIQLIDLGTPDEALGPAGYIPGSAFVSPAGLETRLCALSEDVRVVLVSGRGRLAADWALRLERAGRSRVAALEGGLAAWRSVGLRTNRDPAGLRRPLQEEREPEPAAELLTLEDVEAHVGDPRSVRWIKALALLGHGRLSCVDGRDERGVIGTPGGDAGEYLLTRAAVEKLRDLEYDEETIRDDLLARFDLFGDFYVHTDALAADALIAAVSADARLAASAPDPRDRAAWSRYLNDPPKTVREPLLDQLVVPDHGGCGHLRLMQLHTEEYGVRRGLVDAFLRAIYGLLWDGAPELHLTVLPGVHREGAVLNVGLTEDVWEMSWIPLVSPACRGTQMFVNHPQVARVLRSKTIEFLRRARAPLAIDDAQVTELQDYVEELADRQLRQTLGHLAMGLPVYDLWFEARSRVEVRPAGTIPA